MGLLQLKDVQYFLHKTGDTIIPFEISDEAAKGSDANIRYYGWLAYNGSWVIQEVNSTLGTYRYVAGDSLYSANWTARESKTYLYYNQLAKGETL